MKVIKKPKTLSATSLDPHALKQQVLSRRDHLLALKQPFKTNDNPLKGLFI